MNKFIYTLGLNLIVIGLQGCTQLQPINNQLDPAGEVGQILRNQELVQNNTSVAPLLNERSRVTRHQTGFDVK